MSIHNIFDHMTMLYGTPDVGALTSNNTLFLSNFNPSNAPVLFFKLIYDCQKVATLGDIPYANKQMLQNAIHLLKIYYITIVLTSIASPSPPRLWYTSI